MTGSPEVQKKKRENGVEKFLSKSAKSLSPVTCNLLLSISNFLSVGLLDPHLPLLALALGYEED
jgi:hypothetical protein